MPPKALPKKQKKASKDPKKGKKSKKTVPTVVTMSDSDEQIEQSQSLLDTEAVARLARSEVEDGDGGEASSQRPIQRPAPSATVTSAAALSDEDDEEEDLGVPPPKKIHVSESMELLNTAQSDMDPLAPTSIQINLYSASTGSKRIIEKNPL